MQPHTGAFGSDMYNILHKIGHFTFLLLVVEVALSDSVHEEGAEGKYFKLICSLLFTLLT